MTTPGSASNATPKERQWSMFAWGAVLLFGCLSFIGPLIVMLTKGKESEFVRRNSVEALNFSIALLFGFALGFITFIFGFAIGIFLLPPIAFGGLLLLMTLPVLQIAFSLIGAIKTYGGEEYRLPFNIRLVK